MVSKADKDRPLLLRKRQDGAIHLLSAKWPPRHEFSLPWLLENTGSGVAKVTGTEVSLELANASAVYTITQKPGEADDDGNKTTGYWGKLKEGKVSARG